MKQIKLTCYLLLLILCTHFIFAQTPSWVAKNNFPFAALRNPMCFSIGNKGYVFGGQTNGSSSGGSNTGVVQKTFYEYDPTTDSWSDLSASVPANMFCRMNGVVFVIGTKVYIGFGLGSATGISNGFLGDFWEWDSQVPGVAAWTQKTGLPTNLANNGFKRQQCASFVINNKGYMGLGVSSFEHPFSDMWEYDPLGNGGNGSWKQMTSHPDGYRTWVNAIVVGNKAYMGLGRKRTGTGPWPWNTPQYTYKDDMWEFDPAGNGGYGTWIQRASFPSAHRIMYASFSVDNKVFVGTGESQNAPFCSDFWQYNPVANNWTQVVSLPSGRAHAGAFVINNVPYIIMGQPIPNNYTYTPEIWSWTTIFPLDLLDFGASSLLKDIELKWHTVSEVNTLSFQIQRSTNHGATFENIGEVAAAGNSQNVQAYQYIDKDIFNLHTEKLMYRLKMLDLDGQYTYSDVVEISLPYNSAESSINVYPNPSTTECTIEFLLPEEASVNILVYNSLGILVEKVLDNALKTRGLHQVRFDASKYSNGMYQCVLKYNGSTHSQKIIIAN